MQDQNLVKERGMMKVQVRKQSLRRLTSALFGSEGYPGQRRRLSAMFSIMLLTWCICAPQLEVEARVQEKNAKVPTPAQPSHVNRGPRGVKHFTPKLSLSAVPSDSELSTARVFLEPLYPLKGKPDPKENEDLGQTLKAYSQQTDRYDVEAIKAFLSKHPNSRWRPSLELNLARSRWESGFLSEALELWKDTWNRTKTETVPQLKAIADDAVSELMMLEARIGRVEELEKYLREVQTRPFFGSNEQRVSAAKASLSTEKSLPGKSFKCGPFAINSILNIGKQYPAVNPKISAYQSTKDGTNLAQVQDLAEEVGLHYQMAKRAPGSTVITPSVMHWKLGHFAALLSSHQGRYQLKDPTFDEKGSMRLGAKAIDAESDGYFLVPQGPLPAGWIAVGS